MDFYANADAAIAAGTPLAWAFILALGLISAFGPCTPSRFAWLAADIASHKRPWLGVGAFVGGTMLGYMLMGLVGAWLFDQLFVWSKFLYVALAIVSIYYGIRDLWNYEPHHHHPARSGGLTFLSGVSFAWLFQPCCTPIIVAILLTVHDPRQAAAYLAAYGFAHAAPAWLTPLIRKPLLNPQISYVSTFVLGGISIAVGIYYALLA